MIYTITTFSEEETVKAGKAFSETLFPGAAVSLSGTLGSGKTVFVRGIARGLGIEGNITSPSFTLICEYNGNVPLYHMDLYRISDPEEFEMIGGRELLYSDGITVIEWAEKISYYLPVNAFRINIRIADNGSREITIEEPCR